MPSGDDLDAAKDYDPSITALRDVEAFFCHAARVPDFAQRVAALKFRDVAAQKLGDVLDACGAVAAAAAAARESDAVRLALAAALAVGNYLNGGSARGEAGGFDLDGVAKLATTKGADGTTLAMHVVAGVDRRDSGAVARLAALEPALDAAARAQSFPAVDADLNAWLASKRALDGLLQRDVAAGRAAFGERLGGFAAALAADAESAKAARADAEAALDAARAAFGDDSKQPFDLFRKLLTLVRTLKTAHEANRRRAKPKADAKGGDLFDAFSKTQNDASSLIDEFKRRCEERSASRDG